MTPQRDVECPLHRGGTAQAVVGFLEASLSAKAIAVDIDHRLVYVVAPPLVSNHLGLYRHEVLVEPALKLFKARAVVVLQGLHHVPLEALESATGEKRSPTW